jgi:hypothetical protein
LPTQVVTADGQLKIANARINPDLFQALRGGGGGTFGVVVQATVRAYPSPRIAVSSWWLNSTISSNREIYGAAAYLHTQFSDLSAIGVQGYYFIYPNAIHGVFVAQDKTADELKQLLGTVFTRLQSFPGMSQIISEHDSYSNYKEFYDHTFGMLNEAKYDPLERCIRKPLEFLPTVPECQNATKITKLRRRSRINSPLLRRQRLPPADVLDPVSEEVILAFRLLANETFSDRLAGQR